MSARQTWKPLGVLGTLRFFRPGGVPRFASWRHFGWEIEVEISERDYSVHWWKMADGPNVP